MFNNYISYRTIISAVALSTTITTTTAEPPTTLTPQATQSPATYHGTATQINLSQTFNRNHQPVAYHRHGAVVISNRIALMVIRSSNSKGFPQKGMPTLLQIK